jgi:hypothetical protein
MVRSNGPLSICWETQITASDLHISVIGELSPPNFMLGDTLEASLMQVVPLQTTFGRRGLRKELLEDAPVDVHDPLVLADRDTTLDGI